MRRNGDQRTNPARCALAYREAWLSAVTPEDVRAIGIALVERATTDDVIAARLILDRLLGSTPIAQWETRAVLEERTHLDEILGVTYSGPSQFENRQESLHLRRRCGAPQARFGRVFGRGGCVACRPEPCEVKSIHYTIACSGRLRVTKELNC